MRGFGHLRNGRSTGGVTHRIAVRATWVVLLTAPALAQQGSDGRAMLACRMQSTDGSVKNVNLTVDYDKGTVNGNTAKISDSSITWRSRYESYNLEWVINRYTGEIYTVVRDSPGDASPSRHVGECVRMTERKF